MRGFARERTADPPAPQLEASHAGWPSLHEPNGAAALPRASPAPLPPGRREILTEKILATEWTEASPSKVVGIVASTYVRHQLADLIDPRG